MSSPSQHLRLASRASTTISKQSAYTCPGCLRSASQRFNSSTPRILTSQHHNQTETRSQSRNYASYSPTTRPAHQTFNLQTKYLQKARAASNADLSRQTSYLRDEIASRLVERLFDIKRRFPKCLDLGAGACHVAKELYRARVDDTSDLAREDGNSPAAVNTGSRSTVQRLADKIDTLVCAESCESLLRRDEGESWEVDGLRDTSMKLERRVLPLEELLPFEADTFDAALSAGSMHWINDLPSILAQVNHVLKPDSPFLAAMIGGDSVFELRTSLQLADMERRGGVAPHVSPLADVKDIGGLLQKAGFKMLTVDIEDLVVDYPSMLNLMVDLQAMGEGNAILEREMGPLSRDVLVAAEAIYRELHGNEDGSVPATFRIIHMIAWKEGEGQAKPLPRGSADISMKDVLESKP